MRLNTGVNGEHLSARLRTRLLDPDEAAALPAPGSVDAAVLVPLFQDGRGLVAVLTERHADLRRHAGRSPSRVAAASRARTFR